MSAPDAGTPEWLEQRVNELMADHARTCLTRIAELEAAMHTAGENVMRLTQEAEVLRLELRQAREELEQLREDRNCIAIERDTQQYLADERKVALGRAVAALQDAHLHIDGQSARSGLIPEIGAILADGTATQAADAWRALQELCERADEWMRNVTDNAADQPLMNAVLAWRDARRGGSDCAGCAKVARHPGEGYACVLHPVARRGSGR